jgi:hypothetical protein
MAMINLPTRCRISSEDASMRCFTCPTSDAETSKPDVPQVNSNFSRMRDASVYLTPNNTQPRSPRLTAKAGLHVMEKPSPSPATSLLLQIAD